MTLRRDYFSSEKFSCAGQTIAARDAGKDEYFYEKEAGSCRVYAAFGVTGPTTTGKVAGHTGGFDDPLSTSTCTA